MPLIVLCVLAAVAYFGYQYSPVPECLQTARVLDEISDKTVLSLRWTFAQKAECIFATEKQRQAWLAAAKDLRFQTSQLGDLVRRPH